MSSPREPILCAVSVGYGTASRAPNEFMSVSTPITQRDVAQACGVHPSTICLALKNSPSIPLATRQRIQAVADRLGYHPNVAARHLALRRTDKASSPGSLPIAWINQEERRDHWRTDPAARAFLSGAEESAAELGFHLEEIWTQEPGMSVGRIIQIIRARGIEGVIFPVHRRFDHDLLTPAWAEFALVGCNDLRLADWTDVYAPDYYAWTNAWLDALQADEVGRIGLVLDAITNASTHGLIHASYARYQAERPLAARVPVYWCGDTGDRAEKDSDYRHWLREHRPDVVLSSECGLQLMVQCIGPTRALPAPNNLGGRQVGAAAVAAVAEKMRRFERGLSEGGRVHLIRPARCIIAGGVPEPSVVVA